MTHETRILHVTVNVPLAKAYAFAQPPETFARWARGMADTLHRRGDDWVAGTPEGEAVVRFSEPNDHGVLDHVVELPGRAPIRVPLRMVVNGEGTEVELMLFRQPDMTDAMFDRDAAMVSADLAALKALLERELG